MRPTIHSHIFACIAHPVSLLAASILLANALVFQRLWPSPLTGKLGDAMWMVFAPFGVAAVISLAMPRWAATHHRQAGLLSIATLGGIFSLLKTVPVANAFALQLGMTIGIPLKLLLDPTDLMVLPLLGVSWWIWNHPFKWLPRPSLQVAAALVCGLAVVADQPAPLPLGITCIGESGGTLYAVEESTKPKGSSAASTGNMLASDDGLEWKLLGVAQEVMDETTGARQWHTTALKDTQIEVPCGEASWPVTDPANPGEQLYFVEGKGIYSNPDNGDTLALSLTTTQKQFTGMVVHSGTGNLVLVNLTTILVRTPDGEWHYGVCKLYTCRSVVTPTP